MKRTVFTNLETGKLYHGMGEIITITLSSKPTKIKDLEIFVNH